MVFPKDYRAPNIQLYRSILWLKTLCYFECCSVKTVGGRHQLELQGFHQPTGSAKVDADERIVFVEMEDRQCCAGAVVICAVLLTSSIAGKNASELRRDFSGEQLVCRMWDDFPNNCQSCCFLPKCTLFHSRYQSIFGRV